MSEGSDLRSQLEATLETNKALTAQLAAATASNVIRDQGLSLVKPEDLNDVAVDEIETVAKQLQEQRYDQQKDLVKDVLKRNGVSDSDLDTQAEAWMKGESQAATGASTNVTTGFDRLATINGGSPAPQVDTSQLHGNDALTFGLEQLERQRSK